jgi:hypothetical protein
MNRKITVQTSLDKNRRSIPKITKAKGARGMAQEVESA